MELEYGLKISVKEIGAFTMLDCLEIVQQFIEHAGAGEIIAAFSGFDKDNMEPDQLSDCIMSLRHVFQKTNIQLFENLLLKITSLSSEQIRADGAKRITIADIVNILIEFARKNDIQKEIQALGELIGNQAEEASAKRRTKPEK